MKPLKNLAISEYSPYLQYLLNENKYKLIRMKGILNLPAGPKLKFSVNFYTKSCVDLFPKFNSRTQCNMPATTRCRNEHNLIDSALSVMYFIRKNKTQSDDKKAEFRSWRSSFGNPWPQATKHVRLYCLFFFTPPYNSMH